MEATNEESNLMETTKSYPLLVMYDFLKPETQIFYNISERRYYTKNIPELYNKYIFAYCMEWLVVVNYDDNDDFCLFNVVSKEKFLLSTISPTRYRRPFSLTCLPGNQPNYRVIFIHDLTVSLYQSRDNKIITKRITLPKEVKQLSSAICFNGSIIYGVSFSSLSLIRADLNDPSFEFQMVFDGKSMNNKEELDDDCSYHLTESCGELLMVTRHLLFERGGCIFQVLRADFSTSQWVLIKSIGDRAIFLDPFSWECISCSASESGILGNCIYYTEHRDKNLYVFNLEDRSITMTMSSPTFDRRRVTHRWVMVPQTYIVPYDPLSL